MLEGLFDADRWSTTFQNMGPFWEGFGVTLQVVVAGLLLSLVLGTLLGVFSTRTPRCPYRCSLCTWPVRSFCRP